MPFFAQLANMPFAQAVAALNSFVGSLVWGPCTLALLLGTGVYFTCGTGFFQLSRLWLRQTLCAMFKSEQVHDKSDPHAISQFQSVTTALAGTLGTGNIVGVATALAAGGPGAIFWMWVSAFFGMMTGYAENVLGIRYRYKDAAGGWVGGPMVYLERGLHAKPLAVLFAVFAVLASFGIGNMTQVNGIAAAAQQSFGLSPWLVGACVSVLAALVILGGIKRIGAVTEKVVPLMALLYTLGCVWILLCNARQLPDAFAQIFAGAFGLRAAAGGAGGYIMLQAMRFGIARGVFSNEAGLGSSVLVHTASNVREPVQQGMWSMFEVFADTLVMCTLTALCILSTGVLSTGANGAALAMAAFSHGFGSFGGLFITCAITLFAFATLLGWSYYGQRAAEYLFGTRCVLPYQLVFIGLITVGCVARLELVWEISDTFNGLMALPNLIGVLALSPQVFTATRNYLAVYRTHKKAAER